MDYFAVAYIIAIILLFIPIARIAIAYTLSQTSTPLYLEKKRRKKFLWSLFYNNIMIAVSYFLLDERFKPYLRSLFIVSIFFSLFADILQMLILRTINERGIFNINKIYHWEDIESWIWNGNILEINLRKKYKWFGSNYHYIEITVSEDKMALVEDIFNKYTNSVRTKH